MTPSPASRRFADPLEVPHVGQEVPHVDQEAKPSLPVLGGWVVLCAGGGALIGLMSNGGADPWYAALDKPGWTPPAWLFGPVWTTLYVLMGVAAWLVWQRGGWAVQRPALTVFLAQLVANFAWSPLFFTARWPALALADIVLLWLLVALTIWAFAQVDRRAAWLLAPYLMWVSYAAALNGAIVVLN